MYDVFKQLSCSGIVRGKAKSQRIQHKEGTKTHRWASVYADACVDESCHWSNKTNILIAY